jgi:hypothetical protein
MTHNQMYDLINYTLRGASTKAPLEDLVGFDDVSRLEIEEFFYLAASAVEGQVDQGNFDGEQT